MLCCRKVHPNPDYLYRVHQRYPDPLASDRTGSEPDYMKQDTCQVTSLEVRNTGCGSPGRNRWFILDNHCLETETIVARYLYCPIATMFNCQHQRELDLPWKRRRQD